jgi:hypothetical protein
MKVTFLLCDAAQAVGGKLYILGGGWNVAFARGDQPYPMGLAINVQVPWNATNERHTFKAALLTEDGPPALTPDDKPVEIGGEFDMGRPPGTKAGSSFNVPLGIQIALPLQPGAYRWEISIDGTVMAEESFTILPAGPVAQIG